MIKIKIKVIPQSKADNIKEYKVDGIGNINFKIRVTAAAIDGKANQAVIKLLARHFGVKKSDIEIIFGYTSRQKVIAIHNTDINKFLNNPQLNYI